MHCSFRPVALRLPLSDVAALAAATARALFPRSRRDRPLTLTYRWRLHVRAIPLCPDGQAPPICLHWLIRLSKTPHNLLSSLAFGLSRRPAINELARLTQAPI